MTLKTPAVIAVANLNLEALSALRMLRIAASEMLVMVQVSVRARRWFAVQMIPVPYVPVIQNWVAYQRLVV